MKKIDFTDKIFVNVTAGGKLVGQMILSGLSSMKELMQRLRQTLHQYRGCLLNLELRNSTQGWSCDSPMWFAA